MIAENKLFIQLLYIWGSEWILDALLQFALPLHYETRMIMLFLAILASLLLAVHHRKNLTGVMPLKRIFWLALPYAMIVAAIVLLRYLKLIEPFSIDILRALLLSMIYVYVGVKHSKQLVLLGVWLFALTAAFSIEYLGFTPIILAFFSGLSLISTAWILRIR